MHSTAIAIVAGAAIIGGAILYTNGAFDRNDDLPFAEAVRAQMLDPDSVRFRNLEVLDAINVWCGEVNARNRMGGYAGWKQFIAFPPSGVDPTWTVTIDDANSFDDFNLCD